MITVLIGENSFENERSLERIVDEFNGTPERVDGETLELKRLPDLLMGMSLFASKRLIVIKNLSGNKSLWNAFENWVKKVSDDVHLVLVDIKPDKRTKTYKVLQKIATVYESKLWTDRDSLKAEQWVTAEASAMGFLLDKKSVQTLVDRVGVDQWGLFRALQKLALMGEITPALIEEIIEPNETENAFGLLEAALKGDSSKVRQMLEVLEKNEDPYRLLGLLHSQVFQLATLSVANVSDVVVASDLGVHPFVISKLGSFSKKLGRTGAKGAVAAFASADAALKSSAVDPWLLIEQALLKTAKIAS